MHEPQTKQHRRLRKGRKYPPRHDRIDNDRPYPKAPSTTTTKTNIAVESMNIQYYLRYNGSGSAEQTPANACKVPILDAENIFQSPIIALWRRRFKEGKQ